VNALNLSAIPKIGVLRACGWSLACSNRCSSTQSEVCFAVTRIVWDQSLAGTLVQLLRLGVFAVIAQSESALPLGELMTVEAGV
jgi:hypothetical protein